MLTKSDLAAFRQCPRKLWLEKHAPEQADPRDASTWRRARDGAIVGEKARALLGAELIWPNSQTSPEAAFREAIALLTANPTLPSVEVPLVRDDLYARADALIPDDGAYVLQETKASTFPLMADKIRTGKLDEHLLDDIAIQLWVLAGVGLPIRRAELNLLDNQWRYPGGGDYRGLFRTLPIDDSIRDRVNEVPNWLVTARQILNGPMPKLSTGAYCSDPHPCSFHSHCSAMDEKGPDHPIELLPGSAGKSLARKLRAAKGYVSLLEPNPEELTGKQALLYRRIQRAHQTGQAILEPQSGEVIASLSWPRYYLDFEGIDLPVPRWPGIRPYEQIPFQWSCHIEQRTGEFTHREFLDLTGNDPSVYCIETLLQAIPPQKNGPIFVYHRAYEEGRLEDLARRHPQHAVALQMLINRIVDLEPIVRDNYYHPAMQGSFSIKKVLPTVAPNMDYGDLGGVTNGIAAQVAYLSACFDPEVTAVRKQEIGRELLRYCKLDTWAMALIVQFLRFGRVQS